MTEHDYKELGSKILRSYGKFLKDQNETFVEFLKKFKTQPLNIHKVLYPINVSQDPFEDIHFLDIVESDNRILKKIIVTFSFLCYEIEKLQGEANNCFCNYLALYDENFRNANISGEEHISNCIEDFHKLHAFVKRCHDVVINFTKQLCNFASGSFIDLKCLNFGYLISKLGDMLLVLVILDHLINSSMIRNHWNLYRKAVKALNKDSKRHNETPEKMKPLEIVLNNIEERVISDNIFEFCIESLINANVKNIAKEGVFILDELNNYLKKSIGDLEKSSVDFYESTLSIEWIKVNALFVFISLVFGNVDKKNLRLLMDVNCKAHSVPLVGQVVWYPEQFLARHIRHLISNHKKLLQSIAKARQMYINNKKLNLSKDVYNAQIQISKWSINMNETFSNHETQLSVIQMNHRAELLSQGIKYAAQIKFLIMCFISVHMSQGIPITKNSLTSICKLIEILKCIEEIFQNNYQSIHSSATVIIQHSTYQLSSKLLAIKKNLINDRTYSKQKLDELTALVIVEKALRGPPTSRRRLIINVTLSFVPSNILGDQSYGALLESIESIITVQSKMEKFCDCMFLYWNKFILTHYLHNIVTTKRDFKRVTLLVRAINDSFVGIEKCEKSFNKNNLAINFFNEVNDLVTKIIIEPVSEEIETNLRLHTHTHLKLDRMNPFTTPVEDMNAILTLPALKFNNIFVSVVHGIEHYLSYTFYNLTTVVLHDWRTYGEMRQLADMKFQLKAVDDNLPTQTLEQGLDILDIMRNIHIFVSKYLYNLNNQIFIEHVSNSKTLNTINIFHIANSIRTHGTGIMNTTVNFTYQFLRKKFHNFSQFMYDEQIKSRLIKDIRHFREFAGDTEQMYSYKRADKFNKGIRNLGLDEEGRSYLDLFRILITEIGNAMGYVRMVRSGGLHCCANASAYLPSLEESWSFDELLQNNTFNEASLDSVKNLENTINHLISNFSNGTEYFKLFVDVFSPVFRNPENVHLKAFYIIVPPLTLNFVENILLCKDKLNKKNTTGGAFSDDGFAMGLAYILKLLDQEEAMDSLHWFESVNRHIAQERNNVQEQLSKGSSQVHQALALTQKKLNILEQEFQLLYFSFSSARIFFQV